MKSLLAWMKKHNVNVGTVIPFAISVLSAGAIVITAIANTKTNSDDIKVMRTEIQILQQDDKRFAEGYVPKEQFNFLKSDVHDIKNDVRDIHRFMFGEKVSEKVDTNEISQTREKPVAERGNGR